MKEKRQQTKYVSVLDFDGETYLCNEFVLGWNGNEDWFNIYDAEDLITKKNNIKTNKNGLIGVGGFSCIYASDTFERCDDYTQQANREGYHFTTCEIFFEEKEEEWKVRKAVK